MRENAHLTRARYGMENKFSMFDIGNFFPFHTKIFFHILDIHTKASLDGKLRVICIALLQR